MALCCRVSGASVSESVEETRRKSGPRLDKSVICLKRKGVEEREAIRKTETLRISGSIEKPWLNEDGEV